MTDVLRRAKNQGRHVVTGLLATLLVLTGVRFTPLWRMMENYLDVGEPAPSSADVIVVLDGHDSRFYHAAELYEAGVAPQIMIGIVSIERNQIHAALLGAEGVPSEAIMPNCCGTSTWEEAQAHLQLLLLLEIDHAVIVTNWQHTRRTRAIYNHLVELYQLPIRLSYVSAPYTRNGFESDQFVISEYIKIVYYRVRYGVNSFRE